MRLYEDVISPHYVPGLGGFSITVFTLNNLYDLFLKGRAWWTHSNDQLPLIRYTGCTITLYKAESSDYIFKYYNCYPMSVSLEAYNSTQPSFMQLSKNHRIMRCKKHNYTRKPYKRIKVKPPAPFTNKWFLQKDLANTPLLMTFCAAMSLDRYYTSSNSQSNTTGFKGLNTNIIQFHDFLQQTTQGYRFRDGLYLWSVQQSTPTPLTLDKIQIQNVIFLGNSRNMQPGETILDVSKHNPTITDWNQMKQRYLQSYTNWGNPFLPAYMAANTPLILLFTRQAPSDVLNTFRTADETLKKTGQNSLFEYFVEPLFKEYRYNPFPDTGTGNKLYFVDLHYQRADWDPPQDESLENNDLPLWLGLWGFTDWQKLNNVPVDTDKLLVIQSKHIWPQDKYVVPIDDDFLKGNSPFRPPNQVTPSDKLEWHPKTCFQYSSITNICTTGPATIKLPSNVSAEAHMSLKFYFKLGGCAQSIKVIQKPSNQPDFPLPNNKHSSTSLQSPNTSIENFLYSFDWRRDYLTKKATERMAKHTDSEITIVPPTGWSPLNAIPSTSKTSERTTETTEEEEETLQQLLNLLRQRQHQYKQQIIQLMGELE